MVTTPELGILLLAVIGLLFARRLLSSIKALAINAVGGVLALFVASWFGFGVSLTPVTLIVTALAGIPGAILVVLLSYGGAGLPAGEAGQFLIEQGRYLFDQALRVIQ
ncbi:pro-sigmaK processing inhibitor BofA family protein [Halococcus thailandensis]|uniref:SigmaK-factor processing regulatory BofA n=1 Tax=Halococcus thailandensis JCM 13552 TaxID=1227457 RepID=M0NFC4_9EURY|nr:pro-sigmaK processing inhibitor BofA family protein [Halococcus thailandensis]EMA55804.1 hypothetical protein C451_04973 [Halococcus thailandensis JCM 13552]